MSMKTWLLIGGATVCAIGLGEIGQSIAGSQDSPPGTLVPPGVFPGVAVAAVLVLIAFFRRSVAFLLLCAAGVLATLCLMNGTIS